MSEAIRSDARFSPFADRPEFADWAVDKAARDAGKDVSGVSADEVMAALDEPRRKLVGNLLGVLKRYANSSPRYVRAPLEAVLDDSRAWEGNIGQFADTAVDDLHVAHRLGLDVLDVAGDLRLAPFDVLDALKRARYRVAGDPSWYTAPDAGTQDEMLRSGVESELATKGTAGASAKGAMPAESGPAESGPAESGPGMAGEPGPAPLAEAAYGPGPCAVSAIALDEPMLPRKMRWARKTDPCQSVDYLRSLIRTYTIGENGQLFQAGERLSDRWAEATNWCWPEQPATQAERAEQDASGQSFDDVLYCLRRSNAQTDTVYAMRAELYQAQLENPAFEQAWSNFVSQVLGYLSDPCAGAQGVPSYRCVGVYTAAETLRRAAAAQLTGLARMQIKELACSLQRVWTLFTDPRVVWLIDPAAAGSMQLKGDSYVTGNGLADQAAVVFEVAQQFLGPQTSGLYQAWDKAILLDQVFGWVQLGRKWRPGKGCEEDPKFVRLLGAISALVPGAGRTPSVPSPSLTAGAA